MPPSLHGPIRLVGGGVLAAGESAKVPVILALQNELMAALKAIDTPHFLF